MSFKRMMKRKQHPLLRPAFALMEGEMRTRLVRMVAMIMACLLSACSPDSGPAKAANEIVVGGLYAAKNEDGTYGVSKVLAVDENAVHVRIYGNKFPTLPQNLDAATLTLGKLGDPGGFGIGHAPVAKNGWLASHTFLQKEPVREEELEGYKYYLEEMKK
jgi:hypothetical protein